MKSIFHSSHIKQRKLCCIGAKGHQNCSSLLRRAMKLKSVYEVIVLPSCTVAVASRNLLPLCSASHFLFIHKYFPTVLFWSSQFLLAFKWCTRSKCNWHLANKTWPKPNGKWVQMRSSKAESCVYSFCNYCTRRQLHCYGPNENRAAVIFGLCLGILY